MKNISKVEFESDLLKILEKYGYKTKGIQKLSIELNIDKASEIEIEYKFIDHIS